MANVLNEEKKQQVLALGRLGWPLRKIQQVTRIRRETASQYLKAAGIAVRPPGGWGRRAAKPAHEVITDLGAEKPALLAITDPNGNPKTNPENPSTQGKAKPTAKPANESFQGLRPAKPYENGSELGRMEVVRSGKVEITVERLRLSMSLIRSVCS